MRVRVSSVLSLTAAATVVAALMGAAAAADAKGDSLAAARVPGACTAPAVTADYVRRVTRALHSRRDVWGKVLLAAPSGPTYEGASRYLTPLLLARAANGKPLTDSGVHYAPFAEPDGAWGATSVALHVADGSQILSQRTSGRQLTIAVGNRGRERYGSCLRRLSPPVLADGYLPILETRYVDAAGVRYRQESFAARIAETRSLVSYVRITASAEHSRSALSRIRLTPSATALTADAGRLSARGRTYLFFSPGGSYNGASVKYGVPSGSTRTVYAAWLNEPMSSRPLVLDEARYEDARRSVREYWERRLAHGGTIDVPEQRVLDAERNLLIQNLSLTWRYSIGNPYEQLSSPEGMDVARVMAAYGYPEVSRAILHTSIRRRPARLKATPIRNPNWKMGARLVGFAQQAMLSGDRSLVIKATPVLRRYVTTLGRQINASRRGLLRRERFSSDVAERVYGLHSQAVVWQGLRSMAQIWQDTGRRSLATTCRRLAARLGTGLRIALRSSQRRLRDGSLFVPVRLLDEEQPYGSLTASRAGSYWNLVMPYALASGIVRPRSPQARGVLRYMRLHGSRLLGLVRAGAYPLYGAAVAQKTRSARLPSGSNPVYGLNVARFLADNDQPGELVLSLYGQLAATMAPGTFVSGEGVSIAPLSGDHHRSMYLPPNGASNAAFLETLRLMLVHETTDRNGVPRGLELAYATPRVWLEPGRHIAVRAMPTSFGRISFTIDAGEDSAYVALTVPDRSPLRTLSLRLRTPRGSRISAVLVNGREYRRFDPDRETIDLPTQPGGVELQVDLEKR